MNKIKEMWNGLSKRGAGALGAILILIIFSYIV
jgi:hypothetical protein